MKKQLFILSLVLIAGLCTGCASSERMLRLGADHTNYSQPENERIKGYTKNSSWQHKYYPKSAEADIARDTRIDDSLVNFWPLYLANSRYVSVLWPIFDCDDYGWALRPFYNQEGHEHSILFPISAWNPHNKDGWALNFYWNKENLGLIPLFNTPVNKGFHYYGPVWFHTDDYIYHNRQKSADTTTERDRKWGIFPLLWMNCGWHRDTCVLFPIAGWDRNFNMQNNLHFFGPLWNENKEWGIFPILRHNYSGKGFLRSYFIPFYVWTENMFLSIPYSTHERDYGEKGQWRSSLLCCSQELTRYRSKWNSTLFAYWGNEALKFKNTNTPADYRYFGFFPLFHYADMNEWYRIGFGPFNWLGCWNAGPDVKLAHFLGPFGFLWKQTENLEHSSPYNLRGTQRAEYFASLLLFYRGNKDTLNWQNNPDFHSGLLTATYSSLVSRLRSIQTDDKGAFNKEMKRMIAQDMRILNIQEPVPENRKEADILAEKIVKEYFTEKSHSYYHGFIPFWFYNSTGNGKNTSLCLPFLLAKWSKYEDSTDCYVGTPLIYQKKHSRNELNMYGIRSNEDIEKSTDREWHAVEYDKLKTLALKQETFRVPFWKNDNANYKAIDAFWNDCEDGKISSTEAAKREKEYLDKNVEFRTFHRTSFLGKLIYLSIHSDKGELRTYVGGGLLSKREAMGNSDDFHVLGFLYRYQKKGPAERTFIFPFILKQKDADTEKISFCWRLFNREYKNGKCTGGHILFIPFRNNDK